MSNDQLNELCVDFVGRIDENSCCEIEKHCRDAALMNFARIYLLINSRGGTTYFSLELFRYLESLKTPLTTYNAGSVESAACNLFLAGNERVAHPESRFTLHPASMELNGKFSEQLLKEKASDMQAEREVLVQIYSARTKLSRSFLHSIFRDSGRSFSAAQAKQHGIVHSLNKLVVPKNAVYVRLDGREGMKPEATATPEETEA